MVSVLTPPTGIAFNGGADNVLPLAVTGPTILPGFDADENLYTKYVLTLETATPTITLPAASKGRWLVVVFVQDGSGSRVPTVVAPGGDTLVYFNGSALNYSSSPGSRDYWLFQVDDDGTTYRGEYLGSSAS